MGKAVGIYFADLEKDARAVMEPRAVWSTPRAAAAAAASCEEGLGVGELAPSKDEPHCLGRRPGHGSEGCLGHRDRGPRGEPKAQVAC